ncbi:DUF6653 family protein [Pelagibius sp. CAU 1746]|uniref:DUF6653 family protein n=1 Tax=Pelagibius sp. CAU 1746 TaxID=3140370 RepID=UPI00325AEE93
MSFEAQIARLFAMDEATWARHANSWSVWTRITTLPLLLAAIWSHAVLAWGALLPVAGAAAWIWLNPRVFSPPRSTDSWASRATFGERLWLERKSRAIPRRHRQAPRVLGVLSGLGFLLALAGAVALAFWPMLAGLILCLLAKLWFCDRMVWLYEDMAGADSSLREWVK